MCAEQVGLSTPLGHCEGGQGPALELHFQVPMADVAMLRKSLYRPGQARDRVWDLGRGIAPNFFSEAEVTERIAKLALQW